MITAYRRWLITEPENTTLVSLVYKARWPTDKPLVSEHRGDILICSRGLCACGIHALKDPSRADDSLLFCSVTGKVALWGNVHVHEHGYRADFACPLSVDYFVCSAFGCSRIAVVSARAKSLPQMMLGLCGEHKTKGARLDGDEQFEAGTFSLQDTLRNVREAYGL